jgi:septum formation protein
MLENISTFILASQSPRRADLLRWSNISFQIIASDIQEESFENDPALYVMDIAKQKASAVFEKLHKAKDLLERTLILAADTTVVLENEKINKPTSRQNARQQLENLSGKWHYVFTGCTLLFWDNKKLHSSVFFEKTSVKFIPLSPKQLEYYLDNAHYMDKAGSYAIQESGMNFIERIEGNLTNVVGLPVHLVLQKCEQLLNSVENEK